MLHNVSGRAGHRDVTYRPVATLLARTGELECAGDYHACDRFLLSLRYEPDDDAPDQGPAAGPAGPLPRPFRRGGGRFDGVLVRAAAARRPAARRARPAARESRHHRRRGRVGVDAAAADRAARLVECGPRRRADRLGDLEADLAARRAGAISGGSVLSPQRGDAGGGRHGDVATSCSTTGWD